MRVMPLVFSLLVICSLARGQSSCPIDTTDIVYGNAYAIRTSADSVYSYGQTWAAGNHADYFSVYVSQLDSLNGATINPPGGTIYGSAVPLGTASTTETHNVDTLGFGTYLTHTTHSAYNNCSGNWGATFRKQLERNSRLSAGRFQAHHWWRFYNVAAKLWHEPK